MLSPDCAHLPKHVLPSSAPPRFRFELENNTVRTHKRYASNIHVKTMSARAYLGVQHDVVVAMLTGSHNTMLSNY
jgi:hypothetical protein